MAKKLFALCVVMAVLLTGCSFFHKKIAVENHPKQHFSQYEILTALYGTEKTDTLRALGVNNNDVIYIEEQSWWDKLWNWLK